MLMYLNYLIKILILGLYFMSFKVEISNPSIGIYKAVNCWKGGSSVRCRGFYSLKGL